MEKVACLILTLMFLGTLVISIILLSDISLFDEEFRKVQGYAILFVSISNLASAIGISCLISKDKK